MEIIRSDRGKNKGRISVARTLLTMQAGETWNTTTADIDFDYARVAAHKLSRAFSRLYCVSHTLDMGEAIVITRIA